MVEARMYVPETKHEQGNVNSKHFNKRKIITV